MGNYQSVDNDGLFVTWADGNTVPIGQEPAPGVDDLPLFAGVNISLRFRGLGRDRLIAQAVVREALSAVKRAGVGVERMADHFSVHTEAPWGLPLSGLPVQQPQEPFGRHADEAFDLDAAALLPSTGRTSGTMAPTPADRPPTKRRRTSSAREETGGPEAGQAAATRGDMTASASTAGAAAESSASFDGMTPGDSRKTH